MKASFTTTTTVAAAAFALLAASPVSASDPLGRMLAARQTTSSGADATGGPCQSSADAILAGAPLPTNQDLFSYFGSFFATATDTAGPVPCQITDTPSSLSSAYLAYSSALSSWSAAEYAGALSFAEQGECKSSENAAAQVLQVLTAVDIYLASGCPAASTGAGAGAGATATPTVTPAPGQSTTGSTTGGAAGATTAVSTTAKPAAGARATQAPVVVLAVGAVAAAVALV